MVKFPRFGFAISIWICIVAISLIFNSSETRKSHQTQIMKMSESFFKENLVTRRWNASHGGVYVPITDHTPPNPYLDVPDRDITTTDSIRLTKMNPAYMTRQISELAKIDNEIICHITSLNPIRPENKADEWERKALFRFEQGEKQVFGLDEYEGKPAYRYMAPLYVQKDCLKCHEKQGYKLGQIRGGISVTTYKQPLITSLNKAIARLIIIHFFVALAGTIGIIWFRKLSKKQLEIISQKNEELKKLNHHKDHFFSILAHDLRGPFNGFLNLSKMLKEDLELFDDNDIKDIAGSMYSESRNISGLLVNLLDWSRIHRGKMNFNPEPINLKEITSENIELYSDLANDKKIRILNNVEEINLEADKNMLNTIFRNLINNGIKFTSESGQITLQSKIIDKQAEITITDSGIGIAQDRLGNLFAKDNMETTLGTAKEKGTGLGLGLCRDFIHHHGGDIEVESEIGKGTTFRFTIPLNQAD